MMWSLSMSFKWYNGTQVPDWEMMWEPNCFHVRERELQEGHPLNSLTQEARGQALSHRATVGAAGWHGHPPWMPTCRQMALQTLAHSFHLSLPNFNIRFSVSVFMCSSINGMPKSWGSIPLVLGQVSFMKTDSMHAFSTIYWQIEEAGQGEVII